MNVISESEREELLAAIERIDVRVLENIFDHDELVRHADDILFLRNFLAAMICIDS